MLIKSCLLYLYLSPDTLRILQYHQLYGSKITIWFCVWNSHKKKQLFFIQKIITHSNGSPMTHSWLKWIAATHGYPAQTQPFPAQEAPAFRPPRLPTASAAPSPSPQPPRSRAAAAAWRAAGGGAKSPGLRAARSTWKWRGRCAANEGLTMKHADFSVKHVDHVDFAGKNVDLTMNNNE